MLNGGCPGGEDGRVELAAEGFVKKREVRRMACFSRPAKRNWRRRSFCLRFWRESGWEKWRHYTHVIPIGVSSTCTLVVLVTCHNTPESQLVFCKRDISADESACFHLPGPQDLSQIDILACSSPATRSDHVIPHRPPRTYELPVSCVSDDRSFGCFFASLLRLKKPKATELR